MRLCQMAKIVSWQWADNTMGREQETQIEAIDLKSTRIHHNLEVRCRLFWIWDMENELPSRQMAESGSIMELKLPGQYV